MFSAPFASTASRATQFAGAYQQVAVHTGVEDASPHQLVALLFDGFFAAVHRARGAMRGADIPAKGRALSQAVSIVNEGLKAALDVKAGGKLAEDLSALYAYVGLRLTQANLRNDEAALDECLRLMKPLQEAWAAIGPGAKTHP
ncbi:MAG: flagellar export chaperone FliS [Rubrivivax sp.]|nr:flagellar export chaperone FliS [Rubrivivax sp.]